MEDVGREVDMHRHLRGRFRHAAVMDMTEDPAARVGRQSYGPQIRQPLERDLVQFRIRVDIDGVDGKIASEQSAAQPVDFRRRVKLRAAEIDAQFIDGDAALGGIVIGAHLAGRDRDLAILQCRVRHAACAQSEIAPRIADA